MTALNFSGVFFLLLHHLGTWHLEKFMPEDWSFPAQDKGREVQTSQYVLTAMYFPTCFPDDRFSELF